MPVSGYLSLSQDKMRSRYSSVQEQSGVFAGEGGFDITTGNHTQLDGAVIASTAEAGKNRLDTGTLGFSDIGNAANPGCLLMAMVTAQNQQHAEGTGSRTETVPVDDDLTGGKLVNPAQE